MKKLITSIAAVTLSAGAFATDISMCAGCSTDEASSGGATATAVSAVALIANCETVNAWKTIQGLTCDGNSASCAPNVSSAELRGLLSGAVADAGQIVGTATGLNLLAQANGQAGAASTCAATDVTNTNTIQFRENPDTEDAANQFMAVNTPVGSFNAGPGLPVAYTGTRADDADCIGNMDASRMRLCLVHATSLGDANVGFVKLDGSAPTLDNLMSSNYNLVSNIYGDVSGVADNGAFGLYKPASGNMATDTAGVAYHNIAGTANAAGPLTVRNGTISSSD